MNRQDDCNDPPNDPADRRRGHKHLRVGLEISERGVEITSMWVVDQPAIQHFVIVRELVARVDIGGRLVLVEGFDDPRELRGTYRKGVGHSHRRSPSGVLYVSIPFVHLTDLGQVRVRVAQRADLPAKTTDAVAVAAAFDDDGAALTADFGSEVLQKHPAWVRVADALGVAVAKGRFEIFTDDDGCHRWRLIGPGDRILAQSTGHGSRADCERDVQWVRANARTLPVTSPDVGRKQGPSKA